MKKITVLHLIDSLPREGAEMVIYDLIQQGDRSGFNYLVCSLTRGGGVGEMLVRIGVPVFLLNRHSRWDRKAFRGLLDIIRREKIDIIHTHLFSSHLWGALGALFSSRNVCLFRTEHNMSEWKNSGRRLIDRFLLSRAERVVAVSDPVARSLAEQCRCPERKLTVIENGLNLNRLKPASHPQKLREELGVEEEDYLVGTASALTEKKGHRFLLAAAEKILKKRTNVYFLLMGEGELEAELRSAISEKNLDNRVFLLGSRSDATEIMSLLDVFVLSSIREGLSIALLEAMALGRVPVVTAVGGSVDLIEDGISGFLVEPARPAALAEGIERVLADSELKEKMGEAARKKVADGFDMAAVTRAYEDEYRKLISRLRD